MAAWLVAFALAMQPAALDDALAARVHRLFHTIITLDDSDLATVRRNLPGAISDGPSPVTVRDPGPPDDLPRQRTVTRALRAPTFTDFSRLVEGIHNSVHGWVGGAMSAVPIAAYGMSPDSSDTTKRWLFNRYDTRACSKIAPSCR